MSEKPPVRVLLNVEGFGESARDTAEIDRAKWDAMTPEQRYALIEEMAETLAMNHVGWGWHIEDPEDYGAVWPS